MSWTEVEAAGYAGRAISAKQTPNWTTFPYALQSLLLLLGPTLLAASIYMVLGRLIVLLEAGELSMIKPKRLTKVFVSGDVLSFLAQCGGGGILASAKDTNTRNLAENVILVGLGVQIVFFGLFIVTTSVFHRRILRNPTPRCIALAARWQVPWQRYIFILYIASAFIMVRSFFRLVEYAMGFEGPLQSTEVYIYVFDASLMFIVVAMFAVFPPHKIIPGREDDERYAADSEDPQAGQGLVEMTGSTGALRPTSERNVGSAAIKSTESLGAIKVELQPVAPHSHRGELDALASTSGPEAEAPRIRVAPPPYPHSPSSPRNSGPWPGGQPHPYHAGHARPRPPQHGRPPMGPGRPGGPRPGDRSRQPPLFDRGRPLHSNFPRSPGSQYTYSQYYPGVIYELYDQSSGAQQTRQFQHPHLITYCK